MEVNDILKTIFRVHDEMSGEAVFNDDPIEREKAFLKAEGIRELITEIHDGIKDGDTHKAFGDAVIAHTESFAKGIFYRRNINFNKE